jgi:hypothetical protein
MPEAYRRVRFPIAAMQPLQMFDLFKSDIRRLKNFVAHQFHVAIKPLTDIFQQMLENECCKREDWDVPQIREHVNMVLASGECKPTIDRVFRAHGALMKKVATSGLPEVQEYLITVIKSYWLFFGLCFSFQDAIAQTAALDRIFHAVPQVREVIRHNLLTFIARHYSHFGPVTWLTKSTPMNLKIMYLNNRQ